MNNPLIDVEIYMNSFKSTITDIYQTGKSGVAEEYDIQDLDRFLEILFEDVELVATSNFYDNGDPVLSESQYVDSLGKSIAQYHIDSLMEKGLVESVFDEETMESKFRLTDDGRDIAKKYSKDSDSPNINYYEFSKS